jgi:hypothetical protein
LWIAAAAADYYDRSMERGRHMLYIVYRVEKRREARRGSEETARPRRANDDL